MKKHIEYSNTRNQLYGIKVAFRELKEKMPKNHRTAQMESTLELLETIINTTCSCFEEGNVLEVLVNVYVPSTLPGFEAMMEEDRLRTQYGIEPEEGLEARMCGDDARQE